MGHPHGTNGLGHLTSHGRHAKPEHLDTTMEEKCLDCNSGPPEFFSIADDSLGCHLMTALVTPTPMSVTVRPCCWIGHHCRLLQDERGLALEMIVIL